MLRDQFYNGNVKAERGTGFTHDWSLLFQTALLFNNPVQLFFIPHRSCCSAIGQVMVSDWILRNFVSKWRNKSSEVRLPGHMTKFTS